MIDMRYIVYTAVWLFLFCTAVFPQASTRSSKEAVVVKKSEFVSEEGGFKANFPAKPVKSVSMINAAFGKAEYTSLQHTSATAVYMVAYLDFPSVVNDQAELRVRFDAMKSAITGREGTRLIDEQEIFFGDYLGRDLVFEIGGVTLTMRLMVVEQRLFQIAVTTRGNISKSSETVKKYNKKLVDNFFNSFAVTKLPTPKTTAVELPEDFGVKIEDSNFRSEFFKFSLVLPKGWNISDQEETEYLKEVGAEETKAQLPKSADELDLSLKNTKFLLTMLKVDEKNPAVLIIAAERVSFPNFLPSAMTDNYIKRFLEPNETLVTKTTMTKLGGIDFAWLETADSVENRKQRFYIANRKGIALQIHFTYRDPKDLEVLLKTLQSIRFDEVAEAAK
jgi:hypothetical protein